MTGRDTSQETQALSGDPEYTATMLVHWPTGPVACCAEHGRQLVGLGEFLGTHIVATVLTEPAECVNCVNEGPPDV